MLHLSRGIIPLFVIQKAKKISFPSIFSLNIKPEVIMKVDREQQTPVECQPHAPPHLQLRFADESSSVIQAGITPPDDGSSAMSASDFRVFSPTKACVESQLSMTPPSSTISPVCRGSRPNYLYGRPLNVQHQTTADMTSSSCNRYCL